MRDTRRTDAAGWLAAALVAGTCAAPEGAFEIPLFDREHVADVLVESRELAPPPSLAGNAFLRGWAPWRERRAGGDATHLVAQAGTAAVLGIVNLEPRPRTLELAAPRRVRGPADVAADLRWDGAPIGQAALATAPLALPPTSRLGRVALELELAADAVLAVDGAALREALPAGEAEVAGADLVQSGFSLVDVARRLAGPRTLVGRFEPPADAGSGQSFALRLEREGAPERELFAWRPTWVSRLRGGRDLRLDLPRGWVRLRFLARGTGPAARWRGLAVRGGTPEPAAAPPPAPPAPRLVLLYVMDALRADHVGHLGGPSGLAPTLDRLAGEGVVFAHHRSLAPNTLPSVKNLFTGRIYVDDGGATLPPAGQGPPTLTESYRRRGYVAGLFTGNGYVYYQAARGFNHVEESVLFERNPGAPYNDNAARVHAAVLRWLDTLPEDQRVFLYLHTIHPHTPYDPPPELERRFTAGIASQVSGDTDTLAAIQRGRLAIGEADRARIRALYAAGLAYNDAELDGFLAELSRRYPAPELLAVLTADHGEELFDHGGMLHGYTLYREMLEIPLTLWWPGRLAPRRVEAPTDHLDLHATLRALVEPRVPPPPAARSLWPLAAGEVAPSGERLRFAVAAGVPGGIFSVESPRWKLVWAPRQGAGWGQGQGLGRTRDAVALYDLAADPGEQANAAGREPIEAGWLRERLLAWIAGQRAGPAAPPGEPASAEQRQNLEALGYVD